VSKNAPPTINIAINKSTLLSTNPANASSAVRTSVKTKPTATIIALIDKGIFSQANMIIANTKNISVIIDASINKIPLQIYVSVFIFSNLTLTYTLSQLIYLIYD